MRNSPHRIKHAQRKALRQARQIHINGQTESKQININEIDANKCKKVLEIYKKNLERARFHKGAHASKRTTPGEVRSTEHTEMHMRNPKKISLHLESANLERSRRVAQKMLKNSYKKAA